MEFRWKLVPLFSLQWLLPNSSSTASTVSSYILDFRTYPKLMHTMHCIDYGPWDGFYMSSVTGSILFGPWNMIHMMCSMNYIITSLTGCKINQRVIHHCFTVIFKPSDLTVNHKLHQIFLQFNLNSSWWRTKPTSPPQQYVLPIYQNWRYQGYTIQCCCQWLLWYQTLRFNVTRLLWKRWPCPW